MMKRMILHGFMGGVIGYTILHPVSMFIHYYYERTEFSGLDILSLTFSPHHLFMALFFTFIGAIFGILQGLYMSRITSLYNRVKVLSVTDALTNLYNRRYFFEKLEEEIERAKRYFRNLYLLMIDIDDFKKVNDRFGHQTGDQVLRVFAQRLRRSVRTPDLVARYGGEEFTILMPEADIESALDLARRLCADVSSYPFINGNSHHETILTISVGIAGFPADARDATDLIQKADTALYRAKENGKNTSCATVTDVSRQ